MTTASGGAVTPVIGPREPARAWDVAGLLTLTLLAASCEIGRARPSDSMTANEHNDLGVAYYARGRYALAAREFRRATTLRPGWSRALVNLGDAELARGEADAALDAYEAALRASPEDPAPANNLAWALLQHPQRWPEAEPVIRAALARNPEPRGYYLDTLGLLLLKKGETRDAIEAFRAALADAGLRDRGARALVLRHAARALAHLGELDAAERCNRVARALTGAEVPGGGSHQDGEGARGPEVGGGDAVC